MPGRNLVAFFLMKHDYKKQFMQVFSSLLVAKSCSRSQSVTVQEVVNIMKKILQSEGKLYNCLFLGTSMKKFSSVLVASKVRAIAYCSLRVTVVL
jgi:sulfatase maturation enzyme AslB (radical SAM superfamily)